MQIPVDAIDVVSGAREEDPEKLTLLALNVKILGLINPVVVVPNPQVPGRWTLIAGRRRLAAVRRLGWGMIECSERSLSEADGELVEVSENLMRLDYTAMERVRATERFVVLFGARHPESKEYLDGVQGLRARNLKRGAGAVEPAPDAGEPADRPPTPVEAVARFTGQSPHNVHKAIRLAQSFTDEQAAVLAARNVSKPRLGALAKLPEPAKIEVVNLLGAGMAFPEAMQAVLGADGYEEEEEEEPQTDDEFLAACPARARANRPLFDEDALLYRAVQKHRTAFSRAIAWGGQRAAVAAEGSFRRRLRFFLSARHPREWKWCANCVRGQTPRGACVSCKGGGYLID